MHRRAIASINHLLQNAVGFVQRQSVGLDEAKQNAQRSANWYLQLRGKLPCITVICKDKAVAMNRYRQTGGFAGIEPPQMLLKQGFFCTL